MEKLYVVDIDVGGSGAAGRAETWAATKDVPSCKVVYGMKITGENRLVLVVNGDVDQLTEAIENTESKGSVRCNPLRTYDGFARSVLGVSDTIAKPEAPRVEGDRLYWLHFQVEYKGMTQDQLFQAWKQEAEAALSLRNKGILALFKVVGQREVYALAKVDNSEEMDDISFQLPIMKVMGDNVRISLKEVTFLP
ncbi:hypothetical protein NP493_16g12051 [Ridgeia piscesae]|uniref:Muconolactone isomerase domain-containing protein n=1 Tax=Ridgeia piscesae TaxID=27915 RepID=A0AAD9PEF9_RIDPI|nr:hypothetical protein NP493_16g12051 [Ridgeia piscesae]